MGEEGVHTKPPTDLKLGEILIKPCLMTFAIPSESVFVLINIVISKIGAIT
jgi:hypothetical protein